MSATAVENRIKELTDQFTSLKDWEGKYKLVIELGKGLAPLDDQFKVDKYKVKGCTSQVWLLPKFENGLVHFQADSDSVLVKGIIALLLKVYSEASPDDILNHKPDFLKDIGLMENLTMNRSNGLTSMMKQIQMYAFAFKSLGK